MKTSKLISETLMSDKESPSSKLVSGQLPPGQLPPDKYPPDNYPLGQIPPGHLPPPLRNFSSTYLGILCTYILHILFFLEEPNIHFADIRTAINGSRTSFRTTPTATLCSIFVGLPTTSACEEHFFSCFRLYATPKRLF